MAGGWAGLCQICQGPRADCVPLRRMLGDLEEGVDRSDSKLKTSMRRMQKFIRDTEDSKSGYCVVILIVILVILLVAVVLV